jgi:hypothetical protein
LDNILTIIKEVIKITSKSFTIILIVLIVGLVLALAVTGGIINTDNTDNNTTLENNSTNATINLTDNTSGLNNGNGTADVNVEGGDLNNNDTYYEMVNGEKRYMSEEEYAEKYPDIYQQRKNGNFENVA